MLPILLPPRLLFLDTSLWVSLTLKRPRGVFPLNDAHAVSLAASVALMLSSGISVSLILMVLVQNEGWSACEAQCDNVGLSVRTKG